MIRRLLLAFRAGRQAWRDGTILTRALTSADGNFSCTREHAVEVAYMLNCAEAQRFRNKAYSDRNVLGDLLIEYLDGDRGTGDVMCVLDEWHKEDEEDANTGSAEEEVEA